MKTLEDYKKDYANVMKELERLNILRFKLEGAIEVLSENIKDVPVEENK